MSRFPYYSLNTYRVYFIDFDDLEMWYQQDITFYVYSKKAQILKKVLTDVLGGFIIVIMVAALVSYICYCNSKKINKHVIKPKI